MLSLRYFMLKKTSKRLKKSLQKRRIKLMNSLKEIKELISSLTWTFAKTMPDIPHEYIVIGDYPKKSDEIKVFIKGIESYGYAKTFYGKEYKYLEIDGYKYWVIENIINRAKIKE